MAERSEKGGGKLTSTPGLGVRRFSFPSNVAYMVNVRLKQLRLVLVSGVDLSRQHERPAAHELRADQRRSLVCAEHIDVAAVPALA